jgi:hypothetical protein
MTVPRLTDQQRHIFESLDLDEFSDLALVSTVEKATGKHRALVMAVVHDNDSSDFEFYPVAMLLDNDDIDLFEPPSSDVVVH